MRIKSPIGEYDYRVTAVRLGKTGMEIDGSLGQWQTTTVVGPRELARIVVPVAAAAALAIGIAWRR